MNIAIMTARSGSKSVPQKNIRMLGPLPLLGWGISALSKSTKIDKIILSTDSEKYFEIGKSINSEIIFHKRSPELAEDVPSELIILGTKLDIFTNWNALKPSKMMFLARRRRIFFHDFCPKSP